MMWPPSRTSSLRSPARNADDIFFEQEVIGNSSEAAAIQPSNYLANGKVSEFNFTNHLSVAFAGDITDESKGLSKVGGDGCEFRQGRRVGDQLGY